MTHPPHRSASRAESTHASGETHHYAAFGWSIATTFSVDPYLRRALDVDGPPSLTVRLGDADRPRNADTVELDWPLLGHARLDASREAWLTLAEGAPAAVAAELVAGPILAAALAQSGEFVLHASVVRLDAGAVAVAGHSGAGKSTLAAVFANDGGTHFCDDIVPVRVETSRAVLRGGPTLAKLDEAVAAQLPAAQIVGREATGPKVLCRWPSRCAPGEEADLATVLIVEDGPQVRACRLAGQQAVLALMRSAFALPVIGPQRQAAQLRCAADIARRVPVVRLERPRTLAGATAVIALLDQAISGGQW